MNLTLLSEIKHQSRLPRLLSVLLHVTIITLALISGPISPRHLPGGLVNLALYAPARLILPPDAMGGGGGGGRHALMPASLGKLRSEERRVGNERGSARSRTRCRKL